MEVSKPIVQRKFHSAEIAWANEQLYGAPSKCGKLWKQFHGLGGKVDKVRNSNFAKRHFTKYGKHQAAVAHAIAQNKLAPSAKSEAALDKTIDEWVSFIEKKSHGFKTFDRSDNRALLLYTAKQGIIDTSPVFEEAFYKRVIKAQVRMQPSQSDGIDIVRDFDAIVAGIEQVSGKSRTQIKRDASIEFGYQWHPEHLQKLSKQSSNIEGQRTPEEIRKNIFLKAHILVNYSTSVITEESLQQVLGEDIVHIANPEEFAQTLETMRLAIQKKEELDQNVTKARKEHAEAELALSQALNNLEKIEEKYAVRRNNAGLFGIIDPVLAEIDTILIDLVKGTEEINAEAIKTALGSRQVLVDNMDNLASDLSTLRSDSLSDLKKAQVKLRLRQHFTLDNPVEGIQGLLAGMREPSKSNPTSAEIKGYLVARAEKEYNEQRLKALQAEKEQLVQKQEQEKQQLKAGLENAKSISQQRWNKKLAELDEAIQTDSANEVLGKAIKDFPFISFPNSIKQAKAYMEQVKHLAQNVATEVCKEQEKDSPDQEAIHQNQANRAKLENQVFPALKKWIQKEERYFTEFEKEAKARSAKIQEIEQHYQSKLESLQQQHEDGIGFYKEEISKCSTKISELEKQIADSDAFRSTSAGRHTLTLDYVCDLALRLNTTSIATSQDSLENRFKTVQERLQPFIADSLVTQSQVNDYFKKVLVVTKSKEGEQDKVLKLQEAKEDLSNYLETLFYPIPSSIEDYLKDKKAVLEGYVNHELITEPQVSSKSKDAQVAGRVSAIYEHTIQHTWDEMTKAISVEKIWKNATATRLMPLVAKISGKKALEPADIALLSRVRELTSQTSLDAAKKQAIESADMRASQSWNDETIKAYEELLTECQRLLLADKLQIQKKTAELLVLPAASKKEKEEEEVPLRRKEQKAESREPRLKLNEFTPIDI